MPEKCMSCNKTLQENDLVTQLESADILCRPCGDGFEAFMGSEEIAKKCRLSEVHSDWRTR